MDYLNEGADSVTLNCGYGHGYSVREVLDTVQKLARKELNVLETDRRAGDPPMLIADPTRLQALLDWQPQYDNLEEIVRHALFWEKKIAGKQVQDGRAVG